MTTETTVMGSLAPIPYNSRTIMTCQSQRKRQSKHQPDACEPQSLQQHESQHIDARSAQSHSYSDLVGPQLGPIGHDSVDPGYRKNQPDQREHSRQGALYDGETARHLGTLPHGTHIENRQPWIDFVDGVFHRRRQVDRISLGFHLHDCLVPRVLEIISYRP